MNAPELRDAYAAYRESEAPSEAEIAEVWAGLERRVHAGELGPWLPGERRSRSRWLVATVAAVAVAAGLAVLVAVTPELVGRAFEAPPPSRDADAASFDAPAERRTQSATTIEPPRPITRTIVPPRVVVDDAPASYESIAEPSATPELSDAPQPPALARPHRSEPPPPREEEPVATKDTSLDDELRWLRAARRSLSEQDPAGALASLDEHARHFADGVLAPERRMLEVQALCASGRYELATQTAEASIAQDPHSPWVAKLKRGCTSSATK